MGYLQLLVIEMVALTTLCTYGYSFFPFFSMSEQQVLCAGWKIFQSTPTLLRNYPIFVGYFICVSKEYNLKRYLKKCTLFATLILWYAYIIMSGEICFESERIDRMECGPHTVQFRMQYWWLWNGL